ncbi:MAG: cyanase [Actinobacteria bacterium]|nr:cyanase [Actinomycetota bacterium]
MDSTECVGIIKSAKTKGRLTYGEIGSKIQRHPVWTAAALMRQASMAVDEAGTLVDLLKIDSNVKEEVASCLVEAPMKGALTETVPVDPLIYRFYEITAIYGPAIKEVIHEEFGDGIMSAIDFEVDVQRIPDPNGDRVQVTLNGKFLPYRKW